MPDVFKVSTTFVSYFPDSILYSDTVIAKRLEVSIDSKHMLSNGANRRWLYKMVIGTAKVNPSHQ